MIHGGHPQFRAERSPAAVAELVGVKLSTQSVLERSAENRPRFLRRERRFLHEHIAVAGEAASCDRGDQLMAHHLDVLGPPRRVLRRNDVRRKERGDDADGLSPSAACSYTSSRRNSLWSPARNRSSLRPL